MAHVRRSEAIAVCLAVLASIGASCASPPSSTRGVDEKAGNIATESEERTVDELVEENIELGPELPKGWPTDLIPLPPGVAAVASLKKTSVPGEAAPATAVIYSTAESPEQMQQFLVRELPKKGWTVLESSPPGETMTTAAQGNGYVGIFTSGKGLGSSEDASSGVITLQVILAEVADQVDSASDS